MSDSPRIALNRSERRLTVSGELLVGSTTCNRAEVGGVDYNENADTLTVLVTAGDRGLIDGLCTDEGGANEYELVLEFVDRLPETIVAVERDSRGNRTQTIAVA